MKIADLLSVEDVIRLASPDKARVLRTLARHAADRLNFDEAAVARALIDREALGSTGIGNGIALPHTRLANLRRPLGVFAALDKPVEFGAVDDRPVDLVFLLLLPAHVPEEQLRCLACVARRLKEPGLPDRLRGATEPSQAFKMLVKG
jgi:nitrogen PTS system EIIA component